LPKLANDVFDIPIKIRRMDAMVKVPFLSRLLFKIIKIPDKIKAARENALII